VLGVRQLKALLDTRGVGYAGCVEKHELAELVYNSGKLFQECWPKFWQQNKIIKLVNFVGIFTKIGILNLLFKKQNLCQYFWLTFWFFFKLMVFYFSDCRTSRSLRGGRS